MSRFETAGAALHYQLDGPSGGPVLVLLNALGTTVNLWDVQLPALCRYFRVVRYDHPGHGGSDPSSGPRSVDGLADDLLRMLDGLGIAKVHLCGISLGAMISISIAARFPERVDRLALCCASAPMGSPQSWLDRAASVRAGGLGPISEQLLGRWFRPAYIAARPEVVARFAASLTAVEPQSYAAACEAIAASDQIDQLGAITAPTLVLSGAVDVAAPPSRGLELQAGISKAGMVVLSEAAHLANVEQPEAFTEAVLAHLSGGPWERGLSHRRQVLGDRHVERSLESATSFTVDFQDLITRYAWGEVWSRPGLDRITRRCITIALLVSLGRWEELEMHVRAALVEDLSPHQVAEILLHTAIYCGVPAANSAFDHAQRALTQEDAPAL